MSPSFKSGIGTAVHATLETVQLICHMRIQMVDTFTSLQNSDAEVVPGTELTDSPNKIHDILDNAVSKYVSNTACILAFLFTYAPRKICEVFTVSLSLHHYRHCSSQ